MWISVAGSAAPLSLSTLPLILTARTWPSSGIENDCPPRAIGQNAVSAPWASMIVAAALRSLPSVSLSARASLATPRASGSTRETANRRDMTMGWCRQITPLCQVDHCPCTDVFRRGDAPETPKGGHDTDLP